MGQRTFRYDRGVKSIGCCIVLCCELLSKICMFLAEEGQEQPIPPFEKEKRK